MFSNSKKTINDLETIIAEQTWLEGKITGQGDIYIEGVVSGNIKAKNIKVGRSAKIDADIEAKNIIIDGKVEGMIKAEEKLEITETGRIIGDIDAKILSMAFGAVLNGQCNMGQEAEESIKTIKTVKGLSLKDNLLNVR